MKKSLRKIFLVAVIILVLIIIGLFILSTFECVYLPLFEYSLCRGPEESTPSAYKPCDVDWDEDCDEKDILCQNLYNEIEGDLNKSDYCQTDSDCDVLILGAGYIEFGCYHFINKEVDKKQIYDKMENYTYIQNCTNIINECAPAPEPVCISSKCVYDGGQGG